MRRTGIQYASIKLSRPFVTWLKIEAAKAGIPMYVYLEERFPGVPKRVRHKGVR